MKGRQLLEAMAYIDDELIEEAAPFAENDSTGAAYWAGRRRKWRSITACAAVLLTAVVALWVWRSSIDVVHEEAAPENGQAAGSAENGYALAGNAQENAPADDGAVGLEAADAGGAMITDDFTDGIAGVEDLKENNPAMADDSRQQSKGNQIVRVIEEFELQSVACYDAPSKGDCIIFLGLKSAIDCYDNDNNTIELAEPESYLYHVAIDVFGDVTENGETVYEELQFSEEGKEKLYEEYERMLLAGLDVSLSETYELTGLLSRDEIEGFDASSDYGYAFRLVTEY